MRIIAGKGRGKKLKTPKDNKVRPTLDRVKESLFNILGPEIMDSTFLDIFCGSGAIGIEAYSRGAEKVVFVDKDKDSINLTRENLASCNFSGGSYKILEEDAYSSINKLANSEGEFDYIFMDPPYDMSQITDLLKLISEKSLLKSKGILIIETDIKEELDENIGNLKKYREKTYSISKLSFYERIG